MKALELVALTSGLTIQHLLFILLGAIGYLLQKYLEQNAKAKSETGKPLVFWKEYMVSNETVISFCLTVILSVFVTAGVAYELPDHPTLTAIIGGTGAYAGASMLRKQVNTYRYNKTPDIAKEDKKPDDEQ